jgi:hypothetical protein
MGDVSNNGNDRRDSTSSSPGTATVSAAYPGMIMSIRQEFRALDMGDTVCQMVELHGAGRVLMVRCSLRRLSQERITVQGGSERESVGA